MGFTDACSKQDYTDHYGTEPPPFNFTEWKKEQKELKESVGEEVEEELEETVTEEAEAEETVTEDPVAEEAVTEEAVTEELEDEEPEFYVAEQPREAESRLLNEIKDLTDKLDEKRKEYHQVTLDIKEAEKPKPLHVLIKEQRKIGRSGEMLRKAQERTEVRKRVNKELRRREARK